MPAPNASQKIEAIPLKMAGGNKFGRYPKISDEQTCNMIVSDGALVDYAAYENVLTQSTNSIGRAIYSSSVGNIMVVVWGSQVYSIDQYLTPHVIGNLETSSGDVYISENNNYEIAITDGVHLYVFNYKVPTTPILKVSGVDFNIGTFPVTTPGYISFQNSRLIIVDLFTQHWYLSGLNAATVWSSSANQQGSFQSKPDTIQAAVPTPGGGNNLVVFGNNVVELWQDLGLALFPYQRNTTYDVDYGTLNASSIASLDRFIVWLAANEQSGAVIMIYSGNETKQISTDGINFKLANLTNPHNCNGFLFKQDGHIIYQFTFPDDNLSYAYDINTDLFFTVTDENLNYHIAHNVVFFNNYYYFVSFKGGNLYRFGTQYTNFKYDSQTILQMPRFRIPEPFRLPTQRMFIIKSLSFTLENGQPNNIETFTNVSNAETDISTEDLQFITTEDNEFLVTETYDPVISYSYTISSESVDLSISRDGGENFGNSLSLAMNPVGIRKSRFIYQRLGQANDITVQLRFNGFGRFVIFDGLLEIYQ